VRCCDTVTTKHLNVIARLNYRNDLGITVLIMHYTHRDPQNLKKCYSFCCRVQQICTEKIEQLEMTAYFFNDSSATCNTLMQLITFSLLIALP